MVILTIEKNKIKLKKKIKICLPLKFDFLRNGCSIYFHDIAPIITEAKKIMMEIFVDGVSKSFILTKANIG